MLNYIALAECKDSENTKEIVVMNRDQITAWSDYLAAQMHVQYGIAMKEARTAVDGWLRSMEEWTAVPAYRIPETKQIRNQRRSSRARPAAGRTRSAQA